MKPDRLRAPLNEAALRGALAGRVAGLDVVACTGSTNADLLAAARDGAPDRTVLLAERQDRGRGRLARTWESPAGAGLTFSVLLRPAGVPVARLGWLPLLAGLSVVGAVRATRPAAPVALKWPNDVLLGPGQAKCAGILAEAEPDAPGAGRELAIVLGLGINVTTRPEELPDGATSLHAEDVAVDRSELLTAVLGRLLADEAQWRAAGGDPDATGLRAAYRAACATLGREVRVSLPDGSALVARAHEIDSGGRLVLREPSGASRTLAAGDVVHLRTLPL